MHTWYTAMKIEGNVLTDGNTRNHGTPDVSWTQTASTFVQCLQPGTNGHNMAQDGTNPVEMLGYVLQPYTPLNLKEKELLNAIEGPPTLQSSVIPAWNYVPNC